MLIAKLLAAEDISVVRANAQTASFDVAKRVLTLPLWSELSPEIQEMLIGHEVGHALFTSPEGWHDAVVDTEYGPSFKSYLNVIEDARIEKLVQRKYPGLRRAFIKGYTQLFAEGFFGVDADTINQMNLIDRINTYFKCGMSSGVKFDQTEVHWLSKIEECETWEEVEEVAKTLYLSEVNKEQEQQEQEQQAESQSYEEGDEGDEDDHEDSDDYESSDSPVDMEDDDEEDDEDSGGSGSEEDEEDEEDSDDSGASTGDGAGSSSDDSVERSIESKTDKKLRENVEILGGATGTNVENLTIPDMTSYSSNYVVGYKTIVDVVKGEGNADLVRQKGLEMGKLMWNQWVKENKRSVNFMVQEFEMRKSAAQHKRAFVTKTGVLDPVKMNNYKTSEDIFRRLTVVPDGKNHGFVMVLDLSGSMTCQLFNVVSQTILMTQFCRQINVPFRVYGFTDYLWHSSQHEELSEEVDQTDEMVDGHVIPNKRLKMIEIFNEKMSKQQVALVGGELLLSGYARDHNTASYTTYSEALGFGQTPRDIWFRLRDNLTGLFDLGGTPLDSSLLVMTSESLKFRKEHRLDVLNTIFLTDGASHACNKVSESAYTGLRTDDFMGRYYRRRDDSTLIRCEYNHKTYSITTAKGGARDISSTELLMKMYNDVTGSNTIGYYIISGGRATTKNVIDHLRGGRLLQEEYAPMWKGMLNGTPASIDVTGYHKMFVLSAQSLKRSDDGALESAEVGMTKSKLRTLFKKGGISGKKHRRFLSEIAEAVS